MATIEINESDRGLIRICLEIGRDRFKEHTTTLAHRGAIEQFARQAEDADRLIGLVTLADRVTVESDDD